MSLQNQLDAFRQQFELGGPPFNVPRTVIETVHRGIKELISSGQADRVTKVGAHAPGFALKDFDGQVVKSAELLKRGPLVVTFYRGAWCPYCNLDLKALQGTLPDILSRGATLVAISPQNAANSRKSIRQYDITFPILSDPGGDISAAYGLRYAFPDYLIELYRNVFKNDLALVNDILLGHCRCQLASSSVRTVWLSMRKPAPIIRDAQTHPNWFRRSTASSRRDRSNLRQYSVSYADQIGR